MKQEEKNKNVVLKVTNIYKTYQAKNGEIEALTDINFDITQGEFISIIGPSGCRKINTIINYGRPRK